MKIIGIDASNLLEGGGVTHLIEILLHSEPQNNKFKKIIVWGADRTLNKVPNREWVEKRSNFFLNHNLIFRLIWRLFFIKYELKKNNCDILFSPGGSDISGFQPMVTMCRNMLPFERDQALMYGVGFKSFKFSLLKYFQSKTFFKSNGLIFLTKYASNKVINEIPSLVNKSRIIPHGISDRFFIYPRPAKLLFDSKNRCKIIYVSKSDPYKHHINLIKAVQLINRSEYFVELILIGPRGASAIEVESLINEADPMKSFIKNIGAISYESLNSYYRDADIAVFASSCENMPNILLESMASGLPIACSNLGPMPEILGKSASYFSPYSIDEIFSSLISLINSPKLREELALQSYILAKSYSWDICAENTFDYLDQILTNHKSI